MVRVPSATSQASAACLPLQAVKASGGGPRCPSPRGCALAIPALRAAVANAAARASLVSVFIVSPFVRGRSAGASGDAGRGVGLGSACGRGSGRGRWLRARPRRRGGGRAGVRADREHGDEERDQGSAAPLQDL